MIHRLSPFLFVALALNAFVCFGCLTNTDKVPPPKNVIKYRYTKIINNVQVGVRRESNNARFVVRYKIKDVKKGSFDIDAENEVRNVRLWGKKLSFVYDPTPRNKAQKDKDIIVIKVKFPSRQKGGATKSFVVRVNVSVGLWDLVEVQDVKCIENIIPE